MPPSQVKMPVPTPSASSRSLQQDEIVIAVMGATGSGKSTFVNLATGSELIIGNGLKSCTSKVQTAGPFELCGRTVTLIDTPGFDDTTISDTDILKMIALYLSTIYEEGYKISGVIYMHRISDFRVGGIARRNFSMFRNLCGDENLKNVVIVTNMWGEVDLPRGEAREQELRTDPQLFQPVMVQGAQMLRHDNTLDSAQSILAHFINNHPVALRIQRELVDEGKDISETSAGQELDREIVAIMAKHKAEIAEVQREMVAALVAKDVQTKRELDEVRKDLTGKIERLEHDRERISREYEAEKERAEQRLILVERNLGEEREARERRQKDIQLLQQALQDTQQTSAAERESMLRQIRELERRPRGGHGLLGTIGSVLDMIIPIPIRF